VGSVARRADPHLEHDALVSLVDDLERGQREHDERGARVGLRVLDERDVDAADQSDRGRVD